MAINYSCLLEKLRHSNLTEVQIVLLINIYIYLLIYVFYPQVKVWKLCKKQVWI